MPFPKPGFYIILLLSFLIPITSKAQQAQDQFGKNRVQSKNYNWKYISTYNFDIYYYEGGRNIAEAAANYAENDYQDILFYTGFTPYNRIKIIVYNTATDMQESNIGLDLGNGYTGGSFVGGQTKFVKSKLEVAYKGTQAQFRSDLRFALAQLMINTMLYGGSLRDVVESSYLVSLPEWFVNGASAYIAEGWSEKMDSYIRSLIIEKQIKKPELLSGTSATILGQSIWNYIVEKYGRENMANVLNLTRVVRNEETGIESGIGVLYSDFIKEWNEYYVSMAAYLDGNYIPMEKKDRILKNSRNKSLRDLQMSPDGKKISYVQNNHGRYKLIVYDIDKDSDKSITSGGRRLLQQDEDPNSLRHTWRSNDEIVTAELKRGKLYLAVINSHNGKIINKTTLNQYDQVNSISFSEDGSKMVFSADKKGQTDIYVYDIANNSTKQITNDLFDDLDPVFAGGEDKIAFASNRKNDTLAADFSYKTVVPLYSIFIWNKNNTATLTRVSEYGNNRNPVLVENKLMFLSDEKGIANIYQYNLETNSTEQISNFIIGLDKFSYKSGTLTTLSYFRGKPTVFHLPDYAIQIVNTPLTDRQKKLEEEHPRHPSNTVEVIDSTALNEKEIDINEYRFESDVKKEKEKPLVIKKQTQVNPANIKFKGPHDYNNLFSIERLNSTFMVDPLRGTGILLEADMSDMMGNHRMNAGVFGLTDLKSSSIFGEYYYLKRKIDFKARYDRKVIYAASELVSHRYTLNKLITTASYPLSTSARISVSPFIANTRFTDLTDGSAQLPDITTFYKGVQAQFVYDNTSITGLNMIEGTRAKISFDQYQFSSKNGTDFGKLVIDLRHYQPVHKNIVLAMRASYGQFTGTAKKQFLLGGMDNWLFNSTANPGGNNPLALYPQVDNSNLLFIEYVTNMRGFKYNTQYGSKYLLFNAELRWPIIRYFYSGVINSNFLKNLQATAFSDIGAAWSGKNPFTTDNSINTTLVGGGNQAFSATVINYKNPFLWSYGFGLRTMFLGYYIKGDLAYGYQNYKRQGAKFYFTFGFDF